MTALTEKNYAGECLLSKAPGSMSFEEVTISAGANLTDGTVLGEHVTGSPPYGSGIYAPYDPDGSDGLDKAVAVLLGDARAASAQVAATVIVRLAEVKEDRLVWETGISAGDIASGIADLAETFIIVRSSD